ncbi:hypothetical protein BB561_003380 [Smittium simulii]|uniref:Ubiquitin thioesterase OTU n=1 Tax=Smittium simulii TaxID=133385 RepID=A0A2T9YLL9_9FUNG|nr:hypothetical protein BB561_003380 [Smittium simulii]
MIFKLRLPSGSKPIQISIDSSESFSSLLETISRETQIPASQINIKAGFPPKEIFPEPTTVSLDSISDLRSGDILIISTKITNETDKQQSFSKERYVPAVSSEKNSSSSKNKNISNITSLSNNTLSKHHVKNDSGYLIMREIPDDNSCLFRALTVCEVIRANPHKYTEAILGKKPQEYCSWIMLPTSWGGAIELEILSEFHNVQVVSVDIGSLQVYRFGNSNPFAILLYNGIHYNAVSFNQSINDDQMSEDMSIFMPSDNKCIENAISLAKLVKKASGYANTSSFKIQCLTCNEILTGEKSALLHAKQTGHTNLTQIGN